MIKKILLLSIIALFSLQLHAQRSNEIRKIGRTKYYVHQVKKGHTLYAISKVYSVSVDDIIAANPGVEDGLSIDEEVLIPVKRVNKKEAKSNPPQIENGQLIHTVSKGETLYAISKKYKVSVEELVSNNPQVADGLKDGMKLLINQQTIPDLNSQLIAPALPDDYIIHEVLPKETLYGFSIMYGVSIEEIIKTNPDLSNGLDIGMSLKIPKTKSEIGDANENQNIAQLSPPLSKNLYKVGLFLPFMLTSVDTILESNRIRNETIELSPYSLIAVEFYNGFMMAVDSLMEKGLNIELYVYDLSKDSSVARLLTTKNSELASLDMLIGPFHYSSFKPISRFANKKNIKMVSPLGQPNKLMLNNENLLECVASNHTQVIANADFLYKSSNEDNQVLMLSNFNYKNKPLCDDFENHARRIGLPFHSISVEFAEREFDLVVPENLRIKLDSTKVNRIVVISNDEGYISRLFDRMNAIDTSVYRLEVYGFNNWLSINQINTRYKVKYNLTLPLVHYINYKDERINNFIHTYKKKHNSIPRKFGFLGYDIATYHLNELLQNGTNFEQYFSFGVSNEGLQSRYNYKQYQEGSGFENNGLYFVRYDDYELVLIEKYPFLSSMANFQSPVEIKEKGENEIPDSYLKEENRNDSIQR
jgi:LysM repeat protein